MVVDYTSDIRLPGATPDEPEREPVPILWVFDSYGRLNGYHCVISDENEKCSLMTSPIAIPQYTNVSSKESKSDLKFGSGLSGGTFNPSIGFSFGSDKKEKNAIISNSEKSTNSPFSGFSLPKSEEKTTSSPFSGFSLPKSEEKSTSSPFSGFSLPKSEKKSTSSPFSGFSLPKSEEKSTSSPFSGFSLTKSEEKSTSSPFSGFSLPKAEEKSTSSPFSGFSTTTSNEKPKETGLGFTNEKNKNTNDNKTNKIFGTVKPSPVSPQSISFSFNKSNENQKEENKESSRNIKSQASPKLSEFTFKTTINKKVEPHKAEVKKSIQTKSVIKGEI